MLLQADGAVTSAHPAINGSFAQFQRCARILILKILSYIPAVKILPFLDLAKTISFLDGHYFVFLTEIFIS